MGSLLFALLGTLILVVGCDTSVQAFEESDEYHYSVFGILNPEQDTQWVRVESLPEPTSGGASSDLNVTVTLENLDSGQTWTLRDSLVEVFRDEFQHNFWGRVTIEPSTSYRITVSNPDGDTTWAETTTPDAPPSIDIDDPIRLPCLTPRQNNRFGVTLTNVEELAALQMRYFQTLNGIHTVYDFDHYEAATREDNGNYTALINYFQDLQTTRRTRDRVCIADSAKLIAGAGGPDWPEWARYNDVTINQITRPDSFTNVNGGHGMFSGVYLDTVVVPIERSTDQ